MIRNDLTFMKKGGKVHAPHVKTVLHEDGGKWFHEDHKKFEHDERSFEVEPGEYVSIQTRRDGELNALVIPWNKIASVNYFYPSFKGGDE